MKKLLIGTGNPAKLAEYKELLKGLDIELVSAKDLNIAEPEENEKTFEAEAVKKAQYYFEKSGIPCIVDDGGFEIEALNGEPGVRSRRWIGREMSDDEIVAEVFKRMEGQQNRSARHILTVAIATPYGVFTAHGQISGVVGDKPSDKRQEKFPYRSVLYIPELKKYWIELNDEEEARLSHRKMAINKLHDILIELSK